MAEAKVFSLEGNESGQMPLAASLFDSEINMSCVREVLHQYQTRSRQGNASTRNRSKISGGGAKPFRQKGTGRARAGSNRSPLWRGGAVTFGPQPRSYDARVNKKKKRKAYQSVFTSFARENRVFILEDGEYSEPKSRSIAKLLEKMGIKGKTLIVMGGRDKNFFLSCRNIPFVTVISAENMNIYDLLNNENLVVTQNAMKKLEEYMG